MVTVAGGWETVGLSQGQAGTGAQRRGAWESTKYQLEGKLLFTKYQAERENQKEQAKVSLLKRFRI